jgi:hypothetical protein
MLYQLKKTCLQEVLGQALPVKTETYLQEVLGQALPVRYVSLF